MVQSINIPGIVSSWRLLWNPSLAMPSLIVRDIRDLKFDQLRKAGFEAVIFDKDNTLSAPYVTEIHPPFENAWKSCLTSFTPTQDRILIVSNSAGTKDDINETKAREIESSLSVPVLRHTQKKPWGAEIAFTFFRERIKQNATSSPSLHPRQVLVVGDRVLTDVVYGNLAGFTTVWVQDIVTEKGDNPAAAKIRRWEHTLVRLLGSYGIQQPENDLVKKYKSMAEES